jgi:hypothetical protein
MREFQDLNKWFISLFLKNHEIKKCTYKLTSCNYTLIKNHEAHLDIQHAQDGIIYFYYQTRHFNKYIEIIETPEGYIKIHEFIEL